MTKQEKELYQRSINHFGIERQLDKLAEESAELVRGILKFKYNKSQKNLLNVMEEITDVLVVLNQVVPILDKNKMSVFKRNKLAYLKSLIDNNATS